VYTSIEIDSDVQVPDLRTGASSSGSMATTPTAPVQVRSMVDVDQSSSADMNSDGISLGSNDAAAGASASSSMDVDASPTKSTTKMTRNQARASRSNVWQDMDEVMKVMNGKDLRVGAICKCCKSCLSASSNGDTGHLHWHIKTCKRKTLASSSDGYVQRFRI
jgi:hypothetical protein